MKVSVIVPVYNAERYLEKCIDSVLLQSHKNLELILVDDCSTDSSYTSALKYAENDFRVKVIKMSQNGGPSKARNKGIEEASGEWVMFLDSDDWLDKKCIEKMLRLAKKHEANLVCCGMVTHWGDRSIKEYSFLGKSRIFEGQKIDIIKDVLLELKTETGTGGLEVTGPVCKLYNKTLLENVRFPENVSICEDVCFNYQVIERCKTVVYTSQCMYNRLMREDSLSHKVDKNYNIRRKEYMDWMMNYLPKEAEVKKAGFVYMNYKEALLYYGTSSVKKLFKGLKGNGQRFLKETGYEVEFSKVQDYPLYLWLLKNDHVRIYMGIYGVRRVMAPYLLPIKQWIREKRMLMR